MRLRSLAPASCLLFDLFNELIKLFRTLGVEDTKPPRHDELGKSEDPCPRDRSKGGLIQYREVGGQDGKSKVKHEEKDR